LVSRRQFIKTSAAVSAAAALLPSAFGTVSATTSAPRGPKGTLVIVRMDGGNDGLNTLVPYGDGRYYDYRPNLAIDPSELYILDNHFGFHPSLGKFKQMWDRRDLAVVQDVGYPNHNFSHFVSNDNWQSGNPGSVARDGWLGRYLENYGGASETVFPALAIGNELPFEFYSTKVAIPTVASLNQYDLSSRGTRLDVAEIRTEGLFGINSAHRSSYAGHFDRSLLSAHTSSTLLKKAWANYTPMADYPESRLASDLQILAAAITDGIDLRLGHVRLGGFDTHANQPSTHAELLEDLAESLFAFRQDLAAHVASDDVLIMTWSEFGRRVHSNASQGTDHGWASMMFLMGDMVNGGIYGERPNLKELANDNVPHNTDFRSVYSSVLEDWFGVPGQEVLDGDNFETLPIIGI